MMRQVPFLLCLAAAGCVADDSYSTYGGQRQFVQPQFIQPGSVSNRPTPLLPLELSPAPQLNQTPGVDRAHGNDMIEIGPRRPTELLPPAMASVPHGFSPANPMADAPARMQEAPSQRQAAPPTPADPIAAMPAPDDEEKRARMFRDLGSAPPSQ